MLALGLALTTLIVACGDGSVDTLGIGGPTPPSGPASVTGDAGASPEASGPKIAPEVAAFNDLASQLGTACGGACHADGKGNAPAYLSPPDAYKAIKAYHGIVVKDVATSSLLNKGRHEGPDLVDPLRDKVLKWLTLEAQLLQSAALPSTDPLPIAEGANTIDLSKGGVPGVKLLFTASFAGDILTLSDMKIAAPATSGVHIVFPIFVVDHLDGSLLRDTSFSNADQTVGAGQKATLNPGMLLISGWALSDRMRIELTKIEAAAVGADGGATGGTTGGCKSVASFTANAVPTIAQNGCLNCHNTGGSGNASLDLSGLAATPADDARACAQALLRANPQNPGQSDIILAPTGGVANHPFKNASPDFLTKMEAWIVNEK